MYNYLTKKYMTKTALYTSAGIILVVALIAGVKYYQKKSPAGTADNKVDQTYGFKDENNKTKKMIATITTTKGTMKFELFSTETPKTVDNFVTLAKKGFYDGIKFHRIIKGFMIQGGDPKGDGTGGPGYKFDDEPITRNYIRGTLAMANAGPNTNGSQFFIMHQDYALPKNYVIFGQLIDGFDTLDKIAETPVEANASGEMSRPLENVAMNSVAISEE